MVKIGLNQGQVIIKDGKVLTDEEGVECCCDVECSPGCEGCVGTLTITVQDVAILHDAPGLVVFNCVQTLFARDDLNRCRYDGLACGGAVFPFHFCKTELRCEAPPQSTCYQVRLAFRQGLDCQSIVGSIMRYGCLPGPNGCPPIQAEAWQFLGEDRFNDPPWVVADPGQIFIS